MTTIICFINDCIHNTHKDNEPEELGRCKCDSLGIEWDKDKEVPCCDSYMETPEELKNRLNKT